MDATIGGELQRLDSVPVVGFHPPETPREAMEFLSRSWSDSAFQVSKALAPPSILFKTGSGGDPIPEDINVEAKEADMVSRNPFCFASSATSHLVMERIMSQSEISPFESGRFSHSSSPLNGAQSCGSLTDSPPASPSEINDVKFCRSNNAVNAQNRGGGGGGGKSVGRWLKDRKDKKKEEARGHNAQLHAAVSVAGVAAAVAAIAAATASSSSESGKDEQTVNTDTAVASAATLVAAQCVEAAEAMGAERKHLASVVRSAVNVQSAGDIMTLTAAAATALRGVATLKSRALKEVWNIAAVLPVERRMGMGGNTNNGHSNGNYSEELGPVENFLNSCNQELLARGCELLKRTRKGDLHWKVVFIYINQMGQVMLKMKSKHVAGTITKKKKYVVVEVCKDIPAWPGRQLLQGGEERQYFGLRTEMRGVIEFECRNQREYDVWTLGVSKLLSIVAERNDRHKN